MSELDFYLKHLGNKVFKLLPMREDFENGQDNHLYDYISNLEIDCAGACERFPTLKTEPLFCDVQNDLCYIKTEEIDFQKWRNIILRDTRKVYSLMDSKAEVSNVGN